MIFFIIFSYDEACLVLQERPAFLAFEGHKGRKAKKLFLPNVSEWPKMARNAKKFFPVMTFLAFARFSHKGQWPFDSPKVIFVIKDNLY